MGSGPWDVTSPGVKPQATCPHRLRAAGGRVANQAEREGREGQP